MIPDPTIPSGVALTHGSATQITNPDGDTVCETPRQDIKREYEQGQLLAYGI